ncbi:allatostatins MIP [Topomyia yanbarensis]|uniref:allatostatins MIP n=1 Tax=Topomyia yanbarensis TaxID=2498891 RepID=UPI00273C7E1F|nr:allatostatins MIP [Topomyia yanbarensis]
MCHRHAHQWMKLAKAIMLFTLCATVNRIQASDSATEQHDDTTLQHNLQKRTWKNLQGGWGKRTPDDLSSQQPETETDYLGYSNREENPVDYNAGNDLEKLNRYLIESLVNQRLSHMDTQYDGSDEEHQMDKRAWNKMNGGWGKRVNSGPAQWNKFRGAWGKREPGWNNLKGLWGKRSEKWNKLSSSWGKRDIDNSNSY